MSRTTGPTKEEKACANAILAQLQSQNVTIHSFKLGDKPDLTMYVNGRPDSYEIASLVPEKIHQTIKVYSQYLYRKKKVSACSVIIPMEPDMWIREIIEKKQLIVQGYQRTKFTRNLSLLIHRPFIFPDAIDYDEDGFINALQYAVLRTNHTFKSVNYWSGKRCVRLDIPNLDTKDLPQKIEDVTNGYPAWIFPKYTGNAEELRKEFHGKRIDLGQIPSEHTIVIKPLSPEFQGIKPKLPKGLEYELIFSDDLLEPPIGCKVFSEGIEVGTLTFPPK